MLFYKRKTKEGKRNGSSQSGRCIYFEKGLIHIGTAKALSPETQSGINTAETRRNIIINIDTQAANDPIYKKGEEIACIWQPNPQDINFDGVLISSFARKYESEWSKRDGKRSPKPR